MVMVYGGARGVMVLTVVMLVVVLTGTTMARHIPQSLGPTEEECKRQCPEKEMPVCANNGKTYTNYCFYKNAQCDNPQLDIRNDGFCHGPIDPTEPEDLTRSFYTTVSANATRPTTHTNGPTEDTAISTADTIPTADKVGSAAEGCKRQCPGYEIPVCANNGKTYTNYCFYKNAQCDNPQLDIRNDGPCHEPPYATGPLYDAGLVNTIGSADTTYTADTTGTTVNVCKRQCPVDEIPVCANNGKTYTNYCFYKNAQCDNPQLDIRNDGPCHGLVDTLVPLDTIVAVDTTRPPTGPFHIPEPLDIPGPAETTTPLYTVNLADVAGSADKTGQTGEECKRQCPEKEMPVCANNGKTYTNYCFYKNAQCDNPQLDIRNDGFCHGPIDPTEPEDLTRSFYTTVSANATRPTTHTNGPTEDTAISTADTIPTADKVGSAAEGCKRQCPGYEIPVCANNGKTYTNYCFYKNAQCDNPQLDIRNDGPCHEPPYATGPLYDAGLVNTIGSADTTYTADTTGTTVNVCKRQCPVDEIPVCANNGKTYTNYCFYKNAQCDNPQLDIRNDGPCHGLVDTLVPLDTIVAVDTTRPPTGPFHIPEPLDIPGPAETTTPLYTVNLADVAGSADKTGQTGEECKRQCPEKEMPVCANNGKTYTNYCFYKNAQCDNPQLDIRNDGFCHGPIDPTEPEDLTRSFYTTVSANATRPTTHTNGPTEDTAISTADTIPTADKVGSAAEGCKRQCPGYEIPVCANNGKTYTNYCFYKNAQCDNPQLDIRNDGPCHGKVVD
ncbi:hypothetical protein Pmani_018508 [Petrolisthes manimaculis]|uniref:Kazal-like domain-containing protein n=1 Tax=Petrolisthes manimaculis TaxID=1843537 RepID=A0AAE1PK83_9EUCA|nr:hypothetical protein Pmani_018508 [Petrolisthes manimaculis]